MRNTVRHIIRAAAATAAAAALLSCLRDSLGDGHAPEELSEVVVCAEEAPDAYGTRSSLGLSETAVRTVTVGVYDAATGLLAGSASADGASVTVRNLVKGRSYRAYVLANSAQDFSGFSREEDLAVGFTVSIDSYPDLGRDGVPMASEGGVAFTCGSTSRLSVKVTRLAAKYSFRIDRTSLGEGTLTVNAVRIRQAAMTVYPFEEASGRWTVSVDDGDSASPSDIQSLNRGGSVIFYALENCQGTLLKGNGDPWAKVPSNIGSKKNLCTYLEMSCSYSSQTKESGNVTYRMYLGSDATTNFDIERNTIYTLTFRPTDGGLDASSWKIDPGEVTTYRTDHDLTLSPSSATVLVGGTQAFSATWWTYSYTNGVLTDTGRKDVTASASWSSSRTATASVSRGTATGLAAGSTTVSASYEGMSASASLTVRDDVTTEHELVITPAEATIDVGGSRTFTATWYTYTYTNGKKTDTQSTDVTTTASWSSSRTGVATVSKGRATGRSAGSATVTATYQGMSASATLTVKDDITTDYELVVSPSSASVDVGDQKQFSATLYTYTYTNGVRTGTRSSDVTSSASWSSSRTSVATVSRGTATAKAAGTATISASYSGETGSATLTVKDVVTTANELVVTPTSASVYVGRTSSFKATWYTYTYTNGVKTGTRSSVVTTSATWKSSSTSVATVSSGTATGVSAGKATITATYSGESASADLTVEDLVTTSRYIIVSPFSATINVGGTKGYTVTLYENTYTNGVNTGTKTSDVTAAASWSSSDTGVATVSRGTARGVSEGTANITATYGECSDYGILHVENSVTKETELEVSPSSASIYVGGTKSFTAKLWTYTYSNGTLTGSTSEDVTASATWSSSSTSVATVSKGTATGKAAGTATISASYGGKSGSATLSVQDDEVTSVSISPSSTVSLWVGESQTFTVTVTYRSGATSDSATLSSSDRNVVSVSGSTATAQRTGTATVTATAGTKSASCTVRVNDVVMDPDTAEIAVGGSQAFRVKVSRYDGSSVDVTSSATSWTSSSTSVATVSSGTATGKGAGTATISAKYSSTSYGKAARTVSGSLTVTSYSVIIGED